MSPTKACANDYYERTNDFYSSHLQHERERHYIGTKTLDSEKTQRKESELTTLVSEVGAGTNTNWKH